MKILRKILFPLALIYGCITSIRNYFYSIGLFHSYSYPIPIIAVGNLSVGGTGKTPQIEYLIQLLATKHKIATLSRGYKRNSKGFLLADITSNAQNLGDEPFQFYNKFKNIQVAVDADRKNGINQLLKQKNKPAVILLDDAYQHRRVQAGFYILLTAYDDLFYNDYLLPVGNLRESSIGAKRANVIIVTKCATTILETVQEDITKKIGSHCPVFFTTIVYDTWAYSMVDKIKLKDLKKFDFFVVVGIAKPKPFLDYLGVLPTDSLVFSDHHNFSETDITRILEKAKGKKIITTEKDFVRLTGKLPNQQLYYLPITTHFIKDKDKFDKIITNYVESSTRNS